jgi:hypothetical protein
MTVLNEAASCPDSTRLIRTSCENRLLRRFRWLNYEIRLIINKQFTGVPKY